MFDDIEDPVGDPWAWLQEADETADVDYSRFQVVAVILPTQDGDSEGCRRAIQAQDVSLNLVVEGLRHAEGDWIWLVPDDTEPLPDALATLLSRVYHDHDASVVGALLVEPRRRGAGTMVSEWAQTITATGRLEQLTEPGELHQGQLAVRPALGVPTAGMLVRGDTWRFLRGVNTDLPRRLWGLDFGWRANLAGYRVLAEPDAHLIDHSRPSDPSAEISAGLALVLANTRGGWRWLRALWLASASLLIALGFLIGKDARRADAQFRGTLAWITGRRLRASLRAQVASLPVNAATKAQVIALRPRPGSGIRRAAELTTARLGEWIRTFTSAQTSSLDEMTAEDFAESGQTRRRIPPVLVYLSLLVGAALVAGRTTFGQGSLTGPQLLPAPAGLPQMLARYLDPVAGAAFAGAPWAGLTALASAFTFGQPEWLVTLAVVGAVPLAWLAAYRLLRQLVGSASLAALGALAYGLVPVLVGAVNEGSLGMIAFAILLPVLAFGMRRWLSDEEPTWRRAGAVALWLTIACAFVPAVWAVGLVVALVIGSRWNRAVVWTQLGLVLGSGFLLLVGPWGASVLRYPGRLLTGIEPGLAPGSAPASWEVLIGAGSTGSIPPTWIGLVFFGSCWALAVAGSIRRPTLAPGIVVGAAASVVAVLLNLLVVEVGQGLWVRPQATPWQLIATASLIAVACLGLDRVSEDLQGVALGGRHFVSLALAVLAGFAILLASGWWLIAGETGLSRGPVGNVPPFVRNAQTSATPGRTLVLQAEPGVLSWVLAEGDFARLGDAERGLFFGGNAEARQLAGWVVARLGAGSADEQIVSDLVSLGVAYITLNGGDAATRARINNVPGLGRGTGDATQFTWQVPESGLVTSTVGGQRTLLGPAVRLDPAGSNRMLLLAQPPDPRWQVRVAGAPIQPGTGPGPGAWFALGEVAGPMEVQLAQDGPWWAWLQFLGVLLLALLAAPGVRRDGEIAGPRRIVEGSQP